MGRVSASPLFFGAIFVLLFLALVLPECSGLPWEHGFLRPQPVSDVGANIKRDGLVPCPVHPIPVPQQLISAQYMPDRLRQAMTRIDQSMQALLPGIVGPRVSVGVVYDQELVWSKGYGRIDPSDPSSQVDENTIFRVGSITKVITNIMLFKLRDEGKLSLDDPISKYVPQLAWNSPFKNNPGLTWRSLAGQTSGLVGTTPCDFFALWDSVMGFTCDISNDVAWQRISAMPPTVPQWESPHYADSAYAIIGRALESVVGMSYEDYVMQNIFKPLGMASSYMAYNSWADWVKRVSPSTIGNSSCPSFVCNADLHWARPTGNVYSSVRDLAKLVSLFLVGKGETKNVLGIYSSTLREMLSPSFINDDQVSGYAFPFELFHSTSLDPNLPPYWVRSKAGSMPGYMTVLSIVPEIKTAMIMQTTNYKLINYAAFVDLLATMEQTLRDLQPMPANPGNLTAFAGTYLASVLVGSVTGNLTVQVDQNNSQLAIYASVGGMGAPQTSFGVFEATWVGDNSFKLLGRPGLRCLDRESGFTNAQISFQTDTTWSGDTRVITLQAPIDPFYGWVFYKQ